MTAFRVLAAVLVPSLALSCVGPRTAYAEQEGSVLITTMMPREGTLPDIVTAYGTAGAALDSSMTVSLQTQGRVLRFDVTAGEAVKAGQPLLEFGVSDAALGAFRQAETALAAARTDKTRIAQLVQQQLATKDQLTQANKAIADAQTTLDTLKASGSDKAKLTINAPFDGVVTTIPVAQGDTVASGAPMMTLMRADGLVVNVGIEPTQRFRAKVGSPAVLQPLTSGGATATGKLVRIDGLLNPKTHLIDADIASHAQLLPGASFAAKITVGEFKGYVVPRDVALPGADGAYLFQTDGGKAHKVIVTVVGTTDDQSVVTGPIDPKKPIVVQGNYQLEDGMAVRLNDADAEPGPTAGEKQSKTEKPASNQPGQADTAAK